MFHSVLFFWNDIKRKPAFLASSVTLHDTHPALLEINFVANFLTAHHWNDLCENKSFFYLERFLRADVIATFNDW